MYIESVPNRNSPPAVLLRESFREGGKIKKRTIANLSDWPTDLVEGLRTLLKGGTAISPDREAVSILRSLPHGHVAGALGTLQAIGLDRLLGPSGDRRRDLVVAMIVSRIIGPASIEVFDGNTADPMTVAAQITKIKERFGLSRVVLVGDRGMITQSRIDEDLKPAGLDWITALRSSAIRQLLKGGAFQLDLFDERDMASITSPDYPGERLMVCRNPQLAKRRAGKREQLLVATEEDLKAIQNRVQKPRNPLRGKDEIGLKVGAALNRHKMAKHFEVNIEEDGFSASSRTVPSKTALARTSITRYQGVAVATKAKFSLADAPSSSWVKKHDQV